MGFEFLLVILFVFEFFFTIGFSSYVAKLTNDENSILSMLKKIMVFLFHGKNIFGIIMSIVVFIVAIPSFILLILTEIVIRIGYVFIDIWELGKKQT